MRNSKTLSVFNIEDRSRPILIKEWTVSHRIKDFHVSEDGHLAIVGMSHGQLALYSLEHEPRLIEVFTSEENSVTGTSKAINSVHFTSNSKAIISILNGVQMLDIKDDVPNEWSDEEKQAWFDAHREIEP